MVAPRQPSHNRATAGEPLRLRAAHGSAAAAEDWRESALRRLRRSSRSPDTSDPGRRWRKQLRGGAEARRRRSTWMSQRRRRRRRRRRRFGTTLPAPSAAPDEERLGSRLLRRQRAPSVAAVPSQLKLRLPLRLPRLDAVEAGGAPARPTQNPRSRRRSGAARARSRGRRSQRRQNRQVRNQPRHCLPGGRSTPCCASVRMSSGREWPWQRARAERRAGRAGRRRLRGCWRQGPVAFASRGRVRAVS